MLTIAMTTAVRPVGATYVNDSLRSLREAGFNQQVHVFADAGAANHVLSDNVQVYRRAGGVLGCFKNWARAAAKATTLDNDWILMLQDDVIWRDDACNVIMESISDNQNAGVGFLSPYTSKAMLAADDRAAIAAGTAAEGWVPVRFHRNAFWGAVATLWPKKSLQAVLQFPRFVNHEHHRKLDVVIGNCCRDMGLEILVRRPSLATHIGAKSTLGRDRITGIQWGRYGYGFRANK